MHGDDLVYKFLDKRILVDKFLDKRIITKSVILIRASSKQHTEL
jgi:hypothetical protein